jgi:hypothetical protein
LNQEQLIAGGERQISIHYKEGGGMDNERVLFKMKSFPNSGSVHECLKALTKVCRGER